MGRIWNGFAAQNEVIKLQWAALEAKEVHVAQRVLKSLLGGDAAEDSPEPDQDEQDEQDCNADWLEP